MRIKLLMICLFITPICVLVHYMFYYILNELKQIYYGENNQPPNHSYDILGARMLLKPKEARILKNF